MAEDVRHNQSAPGFGQQRFRVGQGSAQGSAAQRQGSAAQHSGSAARGRGIAAQHGGSAEQHSGSAEQYGGTIKDALNGDTVARLRKSVRRWRRSLPIGNRQRHG